MQIVPKRNKTHVIFDSEAEFHKDADGELYVKNWRQGQEGDWVLTDDGRIVEILKRGIFKSGKEYIRTVCGTFNVSEKAFMDSRVRKNPYSFSSEKRCNELRLDRKHTNVREDIFAAYIAKGADETEAYLAAFPTENITYAGRAAKLLLSTKRIRHKVEEKVLDLLDDIGLPKKRLLEIGKEILEKGSISDKDKIRMLEMFWKATGVLGGEKRTEIAAAIFPGLTGAELKSIMAGGKRELLDAPDAS